MESQASRAVFLSYASQDSAAAARIAQALQAFGVEVWLDQSELRGGDAWDQQIRRQIKECTLFVPLISAHTQARGEGYFRLEWSLAEERVQHFARGVPFLVPVVIDDTPESGAAVPEAFLRVQWTRLPGGVPTPPFVEQVQRLLQHGRKPAVAAAPLASAGAQPLPAGRRRTGRVAAFAVAVVLVAGALGWWKWVAPANSPSPSGLPVVVLMDSPHRLCVYDPETLKIGGSNADDISNALRGLPITVIKEATNMLWDREAEVLKENPAVVVIHKSAFHSPPEDFPQNSLRGIMENKLVAFLGHLATLNPRTQFIVYTRGAWDDATVAADWRRNAAHRFPALVGRIETWRVPSQPRATFRDPLTAQEMRDSVVKQLGLKDKARN